jgi:hypothetical protein
MKVTIKSIPDGMDHFASDHLLVINAAGSYIVVMSDMPMGRWISTYEYFSEKVFNESTEMHEKSLNRIIQSE